MSGIFSSVLAWSSTVSRVQKTSHNCLNLDNFIRYLRVWKSRRFRTSIVLMYVLPDVQPRLAIAFSKENMTNMMNPDQLKKTWKGLPEFRSMHIKSSDLGTDLCPNLNFFSFPWLVLKPKKSDLRSGPALGLWRISGSRPFFFRKTNGGSTTVS